LHETFEPRTFEITSCDVDGTFLSRVFTGWGVFNVGLTVQWRPSWGTSNLSHMLCFQDGGSVAEVTVGIDVPRDSPCEPEPIPLPVSACPCSREELQALLSRPGNYELDATDPRFFHGRAYMGPCASEEPKRTWESRHKPRDDHEAPEWLTATEFLDHEDVIDAKCDMLATLLRLSQKTVVYSGAGISVAACIGQAAAGSAAEGEKWTDALPTKTHYALGALARQGLIHGWVQQNHDGLPQKAGFPQESINEIHGSWYDPSNPVVLYSGTLKSDAYPRMKNDAATADLVIVVGTSLGGLNADQVATKPAERSQKNAPWHRRGTGGALGTVIINLQQTEKDGLATLRLFGTTDSILSRVCVKLGVGHVTKCRCGSRFCKENDGYMYSNRIRCPEEHAWDLLLPGEDGTLHPPEAATFHEEPVVVVPYDENGKRSATKRMVLDFRDGAAVKITDGHNIQGAGQPAYLHIGAKKPYTRPQPYGGQTMQPGPGHGIVRRRLKGHSAYELQIEGVSMELGVWWLDAAKRGKLEQLPVVNIDPVMERT